MTAVNSNHLADRKKQLVDLHNNLNILLEREAKYGDDAPLDLLNQIEDHRQAIGLIEQALVGQLSDEELAEALKPLLLALRDGQVVNITAETYVAGDQIIHNITQIAERALTAAEEAEKAHSLAIQRLAQGVSDYARRLQAIATDTSDTAGGNPYKGLQSYNLSDAELFYGRDRAIAELLRQLQRGRLTILHSESGAGKSSLLQAGIANRLIGQGHLPVYLRPYNQSPILAIKRTFLPNLTDTPELVQAPLRDFLRHVTGVLGQTTTLYLLLDQFEEVFTLLDEEPRSAFVGELADCLEDQGLNVRWVLALRTEFFGNLANFRPRIRNPFENDYRLNRLNLLEARIVIVEPAARQGVTIEPALIGTLLTDLHDEQSDEISPPQIQLVCSALYNSLQEQRAENPELSPAITLQMYEEEGRAQGILRDHLNRVLRRTLSPGERETARQLLIALVSSDQRRIRRTKSDLAATLAVFLTSAQSLDSLLDQLVENRLLNVVEEDEQASQLAYELAHDYLLTEIKLDPETQTRKAAEELLKQEVAVHKRYGTLLSDKEFDIINSQAAFLTLDDDAAELLRLSQAARGRARRRRYVIMAVAVLLIVGAAMAIALIQARSAAQQALSAATAAAGATQASIARATSEAEAVRAFNAEGTAQAEAVKARQAEAEAQFQAVQANYAEATAQAEKEVAEANEAEAQRQANRVNALQLVAQARDLAKTNPPEALLLGLEAQNIISTTEGARVIADISYHYPPLKATLFGHTDWVNSVAWSPDGRQLASASNDQTIIIWDVATGQPTSTLFGHTDWVNRVAWSPDGRQLASASDDQTIIIWDVATNQPAITFIGHTDRVWDLAWSPDGRHLASASADKTVIIWAVATGQPLTLTAHTDEVNSVAWSPDGRQLASASDDRTMIIWDAATGQPTLPLVGHTSWVSSVAWSPDGLQLASADTEAQTVIIWDATTGQSTATLTDHTDWVNSVAWSPDGHQLASASEDQTVIIWNITTGQPTTTLAGHIDAVKGVTWSPDGRYLASASADQTAIIWDTAAEQPTTSLTGHTSWVKSVAFSPNGRQLASGANDQSVRLWDATTGQSTATLVGHTYWVNSVAWSPDGRHLASASDDQTVIIWDATTGQPTSTLIGHTSWVNSVAWSPDGRHLASASGDQTVIIWDATTGQPTSTLSGHSDWVNGVAWSPAGRHLASASGDQTVIIWDRVTSQPVNTFTDHTDYVIAVAWSPDGRQLASASADRTVIIWDMVTNQRAITLTGHTAPIYDVAWSPDGRQLASASADKTVIIWDVATSQPVMVLSDSIAPLRSVAWSPDGRQIAFGGADKAVRLFQTNFIQPPCQLLKRNLSYGEWEQFLPASQPFPRTCPNLPIHPSAMQTAHSLAAAGDVELAVEWFEHLLTLDPTLDLDPMAEAQQALQESVQSWLDWGKEQARNGDVEGATDSFQQALALNPNLDFDPEAEAERLAQPTFENALDEAIDLAYAGDRESAQVKFEEAATLAAALNSAETWRILCDAGARHGFAQTVLEACDKAIGLEPENGLSYNSRGIARLQVGDQAGAQEDFAKFEAWLAKNQSEP